jgi:hypothetical protein
MLVFVALALAACGTQLPQSWPSVTCTDSSTLNVNVNGNVNNYDVVNVDFDQIHIQGNFTTSANS